MKRTLGLMVLCCATAACDGAAEVPGDKGKVVDLGGLKSTAPADWQEEKPSSNLRTAQFRLAKADGDPADAELVIFYFGKDSGGSVDANLDRWKKKFAPPEGKKIDDVAKVDKFKVGGVPVTYLDVSGTYLYSDPKTGPGGKVERRPDHRMFGVIVETGNGPYFITLIGPAKTVERHKKGFDEWVKNFK
jgi:hypothetical protein